MADHDESPVDVNVPLLGRAQVQQGTLAGVHVFGLVQTDVVDQAGTLVEQRSVIDGAAFHANADCGPSMYRMRRIRSDGQEVLRAASNEAVLPLGGRRDIRKSTPGCKVVPTFHWLVNARTLEGETEFRMDVGQTLDMLCGAVDLSLCGGGPDAYAVNPQQPAEQLQGVVADAWVKPTVYDIESAAGSHDEVTFSELWRIEGGASRTIAVPSFAIALKVIIVSGTTLTVGTDWTTYAADGFAPAGLLAFNGGRFSLDETSQLGRAAYIETNSDVNDRVAKLIWTIRP